MLREAVELTPDDGAIVDSLGWAFYRLGRYAEAVRELERAIKDFIQHHNRDPKPFQWVKTADQILASIARFAQLTVRDHGTA